MSQLKRVFVVGAVVFGALAAVLVANAFLAPFPQLPAAPADPMRFDEAAMASRLGEAVRIKTVSYEDPAARDPSAWPALHALMGRFYPQVHGKLQREVVNAASLLFTWQGTKPELAPILLMSHMDVVPIAPGTESDWEQAPFSGAVAGGFVWGRGTLDDKVGVFGILEAVEYLAGQGFQPERTVMLAFGHDEELSGKEGAAKIAELLRSRGVQFEYILDEGGVVTQGVVDGVAKPAAMIGVAEKGYLTVDLSVNGNGGHSSAPPRETPLLRLTRAINRIETQPMPLEIRGTVRETFLTLAPAMPFVQRLVISNLWLFEPLLTLVLSSSDTIRASMHTTAATTVVASGVKDNVISPNGRAVVNLRVLPGDTLEAVMQHLLKVVDDPAVKLTARPGASEASAVSDWRAPTFGQLATTVRQVFDGALVAPFLMIAATDTVHYTGLSKNVYRFLPARFAPEDLARFHGTNERIGVKNYAEIVQFYAQLIKNTAK